MTTMMSHLADRRCVACGTAQPPFAGAPYQRGSDDVATCPGCVIPLRLMVSARDPGGVGSAWVMVVGLAGGLHGTGVWAAQTRPSETSLSLWGVGTVALVCGVAWAGLSASGRRVAHADTPREAAQP